MNYIQRDIIVVENFYSNPHSVRDYALGLLDSDYYLPYNVKTWYASKFKEWHECPFKSSESLIKSLGDITGEEVDLDFWRLSYPEMGSKEDGDRNYTKSCKWNCTFHVKPVTGQQLGHGVHNHVTDVWNGVGENGWVGLIYLNPDAPLDTGLHTWQNKDVEKNYDWMSPPENWSLLDSYSAIFNRLILCRGKLPHSGADGFSDIIEKGRLYQTFFFKTKPETRKTYKPVDINI